MNIPSQIQYLVQYPQRKPYKPKYQFQYNHYFKGRRIAHQLKYCIRYFSNQSIKVDSDLHITQEQLYKQLDRSLLKCIKPKKSIFALMLIKEYKVSRILVKVFSLRGGIISYQTFKKEQFKRRVFVNYKRKITNHHLFLFIIDQTVNKLASADQNVFEIWKQQFDYIYYKKLTKLNQSFNEKQLMTIKDRTVEINDEQVWILPNNVVNQQIKDFIKNRGFYLKQATRLETQFQKLSQRYAQLQHYGRLYTLDTLLNNFIIINKTGFQSFLNQIMKLQKSVINTNKTPQNDPHNQKNHFPSLLLSSKSCRNCHILGVPANKKTKYQCIGCATKFQYDWPLCPVPCFADFHENILPLYSGNKKKKELVAELKRIYNQKKQEKQRQQSLQKQQIKKPNMDRNFKSPQQAQKLLEVAKNFDTINQNMKKLIKIKGCGQIKKSIVEVLFMRNIQILEKWKSKKKELESFPNPNQVVNQHNFQQQMGQDQMQIQNSQQFSEEEQEEQVLLSDNS